MIVITTPTGAIGRQVVEKLLKSDEPLRLIARDPSRLPAQIAERVEVVEGSHGDVNVVNGGDQTGVPGYGRPATERRDSDDAFDSMVFDGVTRRTASRPRRRRLNPSSAADSTCS